MKTIRSIIVHTVSTIIIIAIIVGGIWYFLGTTTVTALVDGQAVEGAEVLVDDKSVGQTPFKTRLGFGHHKVTVVPPDDLEVKESYFDSHFFTLGRGTTIEADFESRDKMVEMTVLCSVGDREVHDKCEVEVDGQLIGTAPIIIELEAGKHEVYVLAPIDPLTEEDDWVAARSITSATTLTAEFSHFRD